MRAARTAMALHAVLKISDALVQMLRAYPIGLVSVASIASISAGVVVDMARRTGCIMDVFQQEEFGVIEIGWLPSLLAVTLPTIRA